jgi:fucose permease
VRLFVSGIIFQTKMHLLVASIIGGALFPGIMGFISDHSSIREAFFVPLVCQAYVLYFALSGYKAVVVPSGTPLTEVTSVPE